MDLRAHRTQAHAVASRLPDTSIRYDVFSDTCFIFNKNIFTHPTISPHLTLGLFTSKSYKPFLHSSHIDLNIHFPFFSPFITNRNFHHPFFCSIDTSYTFQHTTSIESPTFHKITSHFPHTYHPLSYTATHHHTHPHKHTPFIPHGTSPFQLHFSTLYTTIFRVIFTPWWGIFHVFQAGSGDIVCSSSTPIKLTFWQKFK